MTGEGSSCSTETEEWLRVFRSAFALLTSAAFLQSETRPVSRPGNEPDQPLYSPAIPPYFPAIPPWCPKYRPIKIRREARPSFHQRQLKSVLSPEEIDMLFFGTTPALYLLGPHLRLLDQHSKYVSQLPKLALQIECRPESWVNTH